MKISDLLKAFASDLDRDDNEALLLSEESEEALNLVASALTQAADVLRKAASDAEVLEGSESNQLTGSDLEAVAELADMLDHGDVPSGADLRKKASVLDTILLTIAAPKGAKYAATKAEEERIEALKKEYAAKKDPEEEKKIADATKAIEDSTFYKEYRPLETTLSTRYCPNHPGSMLTRVGDKEFQCELDKKIYNWEAGFTTDKGGKVPGTSVEDQTRSSHVENSAAFDSRDERMGQFFERS